MSLDYFGPAFAVKIYPPQPTGVVIQSPSDLVALATDPDGGADLTPFVTSVEVSITPLGYVQASATISPPFDIALALLDTPIVEFGNMMLLQLGYPETGETTCVYVLRTVNPEVNFGVMNSIKIVGNADLHHHAARRQRDFAWTNGNPQVMPNSSAPPTNPGTTPLGIIQSIAAEYKWTVAFVAKDQNISTDPGLAPKSLTTPLTGPLHQTESDMELIHKLVERSNCLLDTDTLNRQLIIRDFDSANGSDPIATLRMWGQVDVDSKIYPMSSFEAVPRVFFQHGAGNSAQARRGPDPTNKSTSNAVSEFNPKQNPNNVVADAGAAFGTDTQTGAASTAPNGAMVTAAPVQAQNIRGAKFHQVWRDVLDGRVDLATKKATYRSGQTATVKTPGNPLFRVHQLVKLDGLGSSLAGPWRIQTISHQISASSFTTTLELIKSTLTKIPQKGVTKDSTLPQEAAPIANVNNNQADTTSPLVQTVQPNQIR